MQYTQRLKQLPNTRILPLTSSSTLRAALPSCCRENAYENVPLESLIS